MGQLASLNSRDFVGAMLLEQTVDTLQGDKVRNITNSFSLRLQSDHDQIVCKTEQKDSSAR